jgi:guanine deaminase
MYKRRDFIMLSEKIIFKSIELARETMSKGIGGPFGACIITPNGQEIYASNSVLASHDPTAHAEICAIRKASELLQTHDLKGCVLYTTCMPCPMCLSAIIWANIKDVYYGATAEDAEKIGFRDDMIYSYLRSNKPSEILKLIPTSRDEALVLFNEYAKANRTIY